MDTKIFNQLLSAGVKSNASDVHLKVGAPPMFRIDGRLRDIKAPKLAPEDTKNIVATILAAGGQKQNIDELLELDTAYLLAEVGRFRVNVFRQRGSFEIILRIIPLDIPTIDKLGLPPVLKDIASNERGLVLVTGVTGSGKSSTLAAMIHHVNENFRKHVLTIEDPIEFLHNDLSCSVSQREIGSDTVDFATALRGALRQDPDVILVGEIRDMETAEIAIQASLTGHLVFSTLHTNDAPSATTRLIDMGIEPFLISSSVLCIMAQRLVRILCKECRVVEHPEMEMLRGLGGEQYLNSGTFFQPGGCPKCLNTGYIGRSGIYEMMMVDDEVRAMINRRADSNELKHLARKKGMLTLREDAVLKAASGITSLAEVLRVTQEDII